jgi:hypothetical protein
VPQPSSSSSSSSREGAHIASSSNTSAAQPVSAAVPPFYGYEYPGQGFPEHYWYPGSPFPPGAGPRPDLQGWNSGVR